MEERKGRDPATKLPNALAHLFSELTLGADSGGGAFMLNSGDVGLLRSLDKLSYADASHASEGGATIAAHVTHVTYGLALMNRWAREGGNPFADARWDEAWKVSSVNEAEWEATRAALRAEVEPWLEILRTPRETSWIELTGMISSMAHLAYHLGAIRQIARGARGPREGTFTQS